MKDFICNRGRVEHVPPRNLDSETDLMSIRRDLLLRSALLRLPDLAALQAAMPAAPPRPEPSTPRRTTAVRRRPRPASKG